MQVYEILFKCFFSLRVIDSGNSLQLFTLLLLYYIMSHFTNTLQALYNQIPRRFTDDNVVEICNVLAGFEDVLLELESNNVNIDN